MSDEELTPSRRRVPALSKERSSPAAGLPSRIDTGGSIRSALTGWQAKTQARALAQITERTRNETELLRAQADLASAYEATALKVNRLRKLPEILALDDAKFSAEQRTEYEAIDGGQAEREHRLSLEHQRHKRELADAQTGVVEARRRNFTVEQGYENQRRLKDRNVKTWATRAEALYLDAEAKAGKLRAEAGKGGDRRAPAVDEIRRGATAALVEALADGNDEDAARWRRVLDDLG
jgi:hypothetical protein